VVADKNKSQDARRLALSLPLLFLGADLRSSPPPYFGRDKSRRVRRVSDIAVVGAVVAVIGRRRLVAVLPTSPALQLYVVAHAAVFMFALVAGRYHFTFSWTSV